MTLSVRPSMPDERAIGARIGRYVVRGVLGSGGCAVVYDAEHRATGRRVALKTLRSELVGSDVMQARFRREVRVLGGLRAPNLVDAIDAGTLDDGSPYLVLERLEGPTLDAILQHGPLEPAAAIEVVRGALEALAALHAEGIVHRDLKPDNIVVHRSATGPVVKLLDLGVCAFSDDLTLVEPGNRQGRLTSAGLWVGTPCYMAPEQVDGRTVDARTDVYAAGVVLYECLTGRTPFEASTTLEVVTAVLRRPVLPVHVVRPSCPASLDTLVLRALARKMDARPQSARALSQALADIAVEHGLAQGAAALALLPDVNTLPIPLRRRTAKDSNDSDAPTIDGHAAGEVSAGRARAAPSTWLRKRGRPIIGWLILAATMLGAAILIGAHTAKPGPRPLLIAPTLDVQSVSLLPPTPLRVGSPVALLHPTDSLAHEGTTMTPTLGNSAALNGTSDGAAPTVAATVGGNTPSRGARRGPTRAQLATPTGGGPRIPLEPAPNVPPMSDPPIPEVPQVPVSDPPVPGAPNAPVIDPSQPSQPPVLPPNPPAPPAEAPHIPGNPFGDPVGDPMRDPVVTDPIADPVGDPPPAKATGHNATYVAE